MRKRRLVLVVIGVILASAAIVAVSLRFICDAKDENAAMVVTWEEGTGKPLVVEGVVLKQGKPVAGQQVDVETASGGNRVTTDPNGRFFVNVGESELTALDVKGVGRMEWGPFGAPSTKNGLRLQVQLK
jgi:hypothetical protein